MKESELKSMLQNLPSQKAPKGFKEQVLNIIEQQQYKKQFLSSQNRISISTIIGILIIPFLLVGVLVILSSISYTNINIPTLSENLGWLIKFKMGYIILCSLTFWSTVDQYITSR